MGNKSTSKRAKKVFGRQKKRVAKSSPTVRKLVPIIKKRPKATMPPAVSDIEDSDADMIDEIPAKKSKAAPVADEDEEGDDESGEEDEYQVEKILDHKTVKGGILYRIKWLGYDDEADETWEPEENLTGALEILRAYHIQVGGTPQPTSKSSAKKASTSTTKGKGKRAASAEEDSPAPAKKGRGRKSEGATNGTDAWSPPDGLWEDAITEISAIIEDEPAEGAMIVKAKKNPKKLNGLVLWNNGRKTQHKMDLLRLKCPQKLLDYYECHLNFVD
ncbi:uncharacterized protein RCC_06285 [Ramularia collo-cygni]|uniref:Chromo domain-containing protein n=1 Tax=Ramularia collo-cygni TaxID=112498 RepID=A0A2D3V127_9PEZI|nr:uncharacterized protein RCC_06285 [Ramularia collo-cygni]CZT20425.1 uncharacterized protein RCC_06285 [Ramularia collo-cygni]